MNTLRSLNIELYDSIKDLLIKPIDISKLPVIGEAKIYKMSAERYGHIILKLDQGTEKILKDAFNIFWSVDKDHSPPNEGGFDADPLYPIEHEHHKTEVMDELTAFRHLFMSLNTNAPALRLDVVGGNLRIGERPYLAKATGLAIVEVFKNLHSLSTAGTSL